MPNTRQGSFIVGGKLLVLLAKPVRERLSHPLQRCTSEVFGGTKPAESADYYFHTRQGALTAVKQCHSGRGRSASCMYVSLSGSYRSTC
eukprot:7538277-Pyramimonas_sp.AAC.1